MFDTVIRSGAVVDRAIIDKEVVIGLQDKDKYNRTHPKKDVPNFGAYFLNPILVRDAEFAGFYAAGGPLMGITPPKDNRTDIIAASGTAVTARR